MRIFFLVLALLTPAVAGAAQFTSFEFFQDQYQGYYNQIFKAQEEDDAVERLLPGQCSIYFRGAELSVEDLKTLRQGNVPGRYLEQGPTLEEQQRAVRCVQRALDFQERILKVEEELRTKATQMSVFGNERLDDAPFDLIQDLFAIDMVLFGPKAKAPGATFPKTSARKVTEEAEAWQVGDKGQEEFEQPMLSLKVTVDTNENKFALTDNCIACHLGGLKPVLDRMLAQSLQGEQNTCFFFQPTNIETGKNFPEALYLEAKMTETPPRQDTKTPEVKLNKGVGGLGGVFAGLEQKLLRRQNCGEQISSKGLGLVQHTNLLDTCSGVQDEQFREAQAGVHQGANLHEETKQFNRFAVAFDDFAKSMESVARQMDSIVGNWVDISEKCKLP